MIKEPQEHEASPPAVSGLSMITDQAGVDDVASEHRL
jgi:hypothetical protein